MKKEKTDPLKEAEVETGIKVRTISGKVAEIEMLTTIAAAEIMTMTEEEVIRETKEEMMIEETIEEMIEEMTEEMTEKTIVGMTEKTIVEMTDTEEEILLMMKKTPKFTLQNFPPKPQKKI